jgi:hypothetical protein
LLGTVNPGTCTRLRSPSPSPSQTKTIRTLLSFSSDGNVVSAARSLQDCLEPEADSRRLLDCSLDFHHSGLFHKHQRRRPRQLFDPQRRSAQLSGCKAEAQGEEQGFLPTCG